MTKSQIAHEAEAVVDHAKDQAKSQLDSIREMVAKLNTAATHDEAEEEIYADALSVLIGGGWHSPGEASPDEQFEILLCTGGPACRIRGDLDEYNNPTNPHIEYQDWGTPWTEYRMSSEEEADVMTYCQQFYFGE